MLRICYVKRDGLPNLVFEGEVSMQQMEHAFDAVISGPEFPSGTGMLVDVTDIEAHLSSSEIEELASFFGARKKQLGHRLGVVVSPDRPVHYGLARMLSAHAEARGLIIGVFTSLDEAGRWLHRSGS